MADLPITLAGDRRAGALDHGEHSSDPGNAGIESVAGALPNAQVLSLEGQGHVADVLDPEFFAARIVPFLQQSSD